MATMYSTTRPLMHENRGDANQPSKSRREARKESLLPFINHLAGAWCVEMSVCVWLFFGGEKMTLAGLEPAIFGSEDQRLIH